MTGSSILRLTLREDDGDVEEERRLLFVGTTRAKDELFLLPARNRFLCGQRRAPLLSPFLGELPEPLVQTMVIPDRATKQNKERQIGLF